MKIFRMLTVLTGLFVIGVSSASAQMMMGERRGMMGRGESPHMMPGMGQHMGMMDEYGMMHSSYMKKGFHFYFKNKEALGLSDAQLEKLERMKLEFKKAYIMDKAKLKIARIELEEILDADSINMKSVEKKVNKIASLKEKILLSSVKTRVEAKKILTEEQKKKAKTLMYQKKDKYRMRRGGGGMMGPGSGHRMMHDEMSMEGMKLREEVYEESPDE